MAQLVRANRALYDYCVAYGLPLISGKDSMKNDFGKGAAKISVPPTLLFTVIARLDDVEKAVTMDAKKEGDGVYALGITRDELGASEYYQQLGFTGSSVPKVVAAEALALYAKVSEAIARGLLRSAHDCSDGGLFVALAETAMAGRLGMKIDLAALPVDDGDADSRSSLGLQGEGPGARGGAQLSPQAKLFSESQSRFVVTVAPAQRAAFEALMIGAPCGRLGEVTSDPRLVISDPGTGLIALGLDEMFDKWRRPLDW
jgi:phosphoribosylformylglycinamidine synthase